MAKIVVIGAGISGLSLAYRLQQTLPQAEITVLEQQDRPGGTIWTEERDGFRVELGPNGFLDTKPSTHELCVEIGLGQRLAPASDAAARNRYLFVDGKLQPLPNGLAALFRSKLLTPQGKWNLLCEPFRRRKRDDRDESIDDFARRRAGREVAETFADALVTGIYAGDPKLLSLPASFPRLAHFEQHYGSVVKGMAASARQRRAEAAARGRPYQRGGKMWSLRDGLRLLVETLASRLKRPPLYGCGVRRLRRTDESANAWLVEADGHDRWEADAVLLTCPAYRQASIVADLDAGLADALSGIAYNRLAVVALGYRQADVPRPLDGFGYIAQQRWRRDVLGVQWCSSIFPDRAPPGLVLLRAMCGGWQRPEVAGWSDDRLVETVRTDLRFSLGIAAAPVMQHIVRWDRAIPQYQLGHLQRVADIEQQAARYRGLFLAGNAYHGVAMNDCTEQAGIVAARVRALLNK